MLDSLKANKERFFNQIIKSGIHRNGQSGHQYQNWNAVFLSIAGYVHPEWLTFKQAVGLGYKIRKGERGTTIAICKQYSASVEKNGETKLENKTYLSSATVFNLEQMDGTEERVRSYKLGSDRNVIDAEQIIKNYTGGPEIIEGGTDKAYYTSFGDYVKMPARNQYSGIHHFYRTLFHELVHSTGHEDRLNRTSLVNYEYDNNRPFEELVAELGSALLCRQAGLTQEDLFNNSIAYLQSWFKWLDGNEEKFLSALTEAQKAVKMILGKEFQIDQFFDDTEKEEAEKEVLEAA